MQIPDSTFVQQIADSLRDFALDHLWQWIAGLLVAAVVALRAYSKGVHGPILYLLAGAVIGIGSVVGVTALLAWSRYVFYGTLGSFFLGWMIFGAIRVYRREQARLQGHAKGLVDYRRDFRAALPRNLKAMARLTRDTQSIGANTVRLTTRLQNTASETAQETILDQTAARMYRSAAIQYRRHAQTFQQASSAFTTAMAGMLGWIQQSGNMMQLQQYRPIMESFRDSVVSARANTSSFRNSLIALPNMSQRLNASRAELVEGIDVSLATMDAVISFAEQTLGQLPA
jgi:hypothetical protein